MSIFNIFKKKNISVLDALQNSPAFKEQKELYDAMAIMCASGIIADEFPDGVGEFGVTPENPIPCKTTFGSTSYLGRLRAFDGTKVLYERIGSSINSKIQYPIDAYSISHHSGYNLATLYISPYQNKNSNKSPDNFILLKTINDHADPEEIRRLSVLRLLRTIFPIKFNLNLIELIDLFFEANKVFATLKQTRFHANNIENGFDFTLEGDFEIGYVPLPQGPSEFLPKFFKKVKELEQYILSLDDDTYIDEIDDNAKQIFDSEALSEVWIKIR
jgi:hypothetical protein